MEMWAMIKYEEQFANALLLWNYEVCEQGLVREMGFKAKAWATQMGRGYGVDPAKIKASSKRYSLSPCTG